MSGRKNKNSSEEAKLTEPGDEKRLTLEAVPKPPLAAPEPFRSLVISIPCYGGQIFVDAMNSLLRTTMDLTQRRIVMSVSVLAGDSLIQRARNSAVAQFLQTDASHLLFIDADMTWRPEDVVRLIQAQRDIVCGGYVRKTEAADFTFGADIDARGAGYMERGLLRVRHAATGFMMIGRNVFTQMQVQLPRYTEAHLVDKSGERLPVYPWFECEVVNGAFWSEDFAFCNRWRAMGGDERRG
jgi:hypothetical protein